MPAAKAAKTQVGLRIGDGLRIGARTSRRVLPPARRISALEARRLAPALAEGGLRGALLSWDGQLEDDARLVVAVARTAAAHGARILTYAGVTGVRDDGVDAVDGLTGAAFSVRARHVILATGVWAGELGAGVALRPSRGSHLLVPAGRLGDPRAAVNVPVPGERGRWVFALPRTDGLVAIGLTDVAADGPIPDEPRPSAEEEATLLEHASAALEVTLGPEDVAGRYAGLRPLLADGEPAHATADLSRRHAVVDDADTGALTVVGGKLTTYRAMAQDAVDRITRAAVPHRTARAGGRGRRRCRRPAPPRPPLRRGGRGRRARSAPRSRSRRACRSARRSCAGPPRTSSRSRPRTSPTGAPAPGWCPNGARRCWPPPMRRSLDGAPTPLRGRRRPRRRADPRPRHAALHAHPRAASGGLRALVVRAL